MLIGKLIDFLLFFKAFPYRQPGVGGGGGSGVSSLGKLRPGGNHLPSHSHVGVSGD